MRKIFLSSLMLALSLTTFAQLPYETELKKDQFEDPTIVISKSDQCKWDWTTVSSTCLGLGTNITATTNSFVVALPSVGLPQKVDFNYSTPMFVLWGEGTIRVSESTDHENWSDVWSKDVNSVKYEQEGSANLNSNTRYLKFEYTGQKAVYIYGIKVKELKELSTNIDEWQFKNAKVDDPMDTKEVTVTWTNVVASVTSTNPAFTVSTQSIGQKNKKDQQTKLVISYSHETYGEQEGEIIIEGEGLKSTIKVSGSTSRYPLVLTWTDPAGEYKTTDNLTLYAVTDYGQPVLYKTSDPEIALVDSATCHVTIKCSGMVDITAYHPGDRKYEPSNQITKTYTFVKADPTVAFTVDPIVYGDELNKVNLTEKMGKIPGTATFKDYSMTDKLGAGTYNNVVVVFTPDDECIYNTVTRYVTIFVDKAQQSIEWNQGQTSLYVDQSLRMTAHASSGLDLTYAFTACNIRIDGEYLQGVEAGDVLVIAFQAGNENYYPSTVAMQAFEVLPKTPTAERMIEANPSEEELNENGKKYYHNGEVYIYYRGRIYTEDGKVIK